MYSSSLRDFVANNRVSTDGFFAINTQRIEGKNFLNRLQQLKLVKTLLRNLPIGRQAPISAASAQFPGKFHHHCRNFLNLAL
jgi:hypothetical protein